MSTRLATDRGAGSVIDRSGDVTQPMPADLEAFIVRIGEKDSDLFRCGWPFSFERENMHLRGTRQQLHIFLEDR
jgi:hypothetical protein